MTKTSEVIRRVVVFAVPAALGVLAILYAGNLRQLPEPSARAAKPAPVRVISIAPIDLIPRVSGFGTVEPVREWRAVARIAGEVTEIADPLAPGELVAQGALLFRIDDSDLRLDLAGVDAQIAASRVEDDTIRARLALAQSDLALAQEELARQQQLNRQGVATQAALDTARRQELSARSDVTGLQSQITLNAAEREVLAIQRASLERALGFAEIRAPDDLRVTDLSADLGQYVSIGQTLMTGEGVDAVDIEAQFPIGRIGPLLRLVGNGATVLDLDATVKLPAPGHSVSWAARVARVGEAIDAQTQSAPVVVRVTDPLAKSVAGKRPPLRRNMFVEVQLSAPKQSALVVPAEAVRGGSALVVSAENTLERRPVETGFTSGDIAVVTRGLAAGDRLVVTDPSIAVPGMTVRPVEDEARKAEIAALAAGRPAAAKPAPQPGSGKGMGMGTGAGQGKDPSQ